MVTYHNHLGRRVPRRLAVDEAGECWPGYFAHYPDREANAAAVANGFPNAKAYAAAIDHQRNATRRAQP